MLATPTAVEQVFNRKHGHSSTLGRGPARRRWFGYFTPDEVYEATVDSLVGPTTEWLDAGGGRSVFPPNPTLARELADRCRLLVGVDPSENIESNSFVHRYVRCPIEEYRTSMRFDLLTLRMVAEHIQEPEKVAAALRNLTKPGGKLLIYTVNRRSPVTMISALLPLPFHHPIKRLIWRTEERNIFRATRKWNTRRELRKLLEVNGFREYDFSYLDDCRVLARWTVTNCLELALWRVLRACGLHYPETSILAVFERV